MTRRRHDVGNVFQWVVTLGALVSLGACVGFEPEAEPGTTSAPSHLGADFGNATSHNAAQHIIDPAPPNARAGAPGMDGARAGEAIRRYRSGSVVEPQPLETSSFGDRR